MTTVKILLLSTAAVVGIGGTSAALTKDKWWPKGGTNPIQEEGQRNPTDAEAGKVPLKSKPDCQGSPETQDCKTIEGDNVAPKRST